MRGLPGTDHFPWVGDTEAVPGEVEEFLTGVRHGPEPDPVLATVMFTDIVRAPRKRPRGWATRGGARCLKAITAMVREHLTRFRGHEIDTAGDGFLATFDGPARAVRCAQGIVEAVGDIGIQVRAGVHTGEVELAGDGIRGIAVHVGARVAALAAPNEVLVTGTVRDLVAGSGIEFDDRGSHLLKGVPGEWRLFAPRRDGLPPGR